MAQITEDEAEQELHVGVIRVDRRGLVEDAQRRVQHAPVVKRLTQVVTGHGAPGFHLAGALEPLAGQLLSAAGLLCQAQLHQRGSVPGVAAEQFLKLLHGPVVLSQSQIGPAQLQPQVPIAGEPD